MSAPSSQANGHRRQRGRRADGRVLPHDSVCEASVLGGVILRNTLLERLDTLETNDFYDAKHKVVWEAMRNLEAARKPIDITMLEAEIEKVGKLDAIGGLAFLGGLAVNVPTADNVLHYAKIVRDKALLRRVILKASDIADRGYDWEYEPDELLGEMTAELQGIDRRYREANEALPTITIEGSLDELERLANTPVFPTPYPELNKNLGFDGLLSGQIYYLTGGTGFGKTSFIGGIVRHHAEQERPAIIGFWEMFSAYYTARMAAGVLGVHANRILRGGVARDAIRAALPTRFIEMYDAPSLSTLKRAAERCVRRHNAPPLIIVDYVQLLGDQIMATMARPDPRLANSQASAGLRQLAKETGAAIIAVSAAGRSASKKLAADVRKQHARDLIDASKESGSIEFDGAGVIVLSVSSDKDGDEDIATISIAKARFGETRHIDARYDGRTGVWREIGPVATVTKATPRPDDGSLRAAIVRVLEEKGPLSKNKIWEFSGKNKAAVLSEIDRMLSEEPRALNYVKNRIGLPRHLDELAAKAAAQPSLTQVLDAQIAAAERSIDVVSEAGSEAVPETGSGGQA